MRIIMTTFILSMSLSLYAQTAKETRPSDSPVPPTDFDEKARPQAETPSSTAQRQEQAPIKNTYKIGPYDTKGEYIFFNRLQREQREAEEEKSEQQ